MKSDGIKLPDGKEMRSLNECDGYKYLGVTEADEIKKKEIKEKVGKEYKRRIRKILETGKTEWRECYKRDQHLCNILTKILCCIS